jgi:hypothetical protein
MNGVRFTRSASVKERDIARRNVEQIDLLFFVHENRAKSRSALGAGRDVSHCRWAFPRHQANGAGFSPRRTCCGPSAGRGDDRSQCGRQGTPLARQASRGNFKGVRARGHRQKRIASIRCTPAWLPESLLRTGDGDLCAERQIGKRQAISRSYSS